MFKHLPGVLLILVSLDIAAEAGGNGDVRDPTTPLGASISPVVVDFKPTLELNSVLISAQRKLVIINGNNLREGQLVPGSDGIKVQRILPQKVILKQGEKEWAMTLSPRVVKRR